MSKIINETLMALCFQEALDLMGEAKTPYRDRIEKNRKLSKSIKAGEKIIDKKFWGLKPALDIQKRTTGEEKAEWEKRNTATSGEIHTNLRNID